MDAVDRKLLHYLDVDSRYHVKEIASLLGEKSEKINYRLKRLLRERIVKRFHPEVDPWKIGFTSFKVYFQFQGVDREDLDEMYNFLVDNCNAGWCASCLGRWDMIVEMLAHDRHEFMRLYSKFHRKYYEHILFKEVGVTTEFVLTNKKWLAPDIPGMNASVFMGHPQKLVDDKDMSILRYLVNNGRDPVKKIASSLGMPATTVSQRIAGMMKKGVIVNFRTDIDLKKFNRVYCKSFIYYSRGLESDVKPMVDFCVKNPSIVYITKCIAPWDMEIEAHTHSFNEFTDLMNDLRNRFPNVVRNFEAVVIGKETGSLCLPPPQ